MKIIKRNNTTLYESKYFLNINNNYLVSSKIRNLNEYYNNVVNCSLPVNNTGADIASTLKYFSQTLLRYYLLINCLKNKF